MDKLFDNLMERLFIESNFSLTRSEYVEEDYKCSTLLYIGQNQQGDYFIYLQLPERLLPYVNNDIQIRLAALIKNQANDFEKMTDGEVKISSSFDKNATLIIFTTHVAGVNENVVKQAISIEEDPYFFKKQVLLISDKETPTLAINFSENKESFIAYVQRLISDTERFNEFTSTNLFGLTDKGVEYSFIARLYEKVPFLSLMVTPSNQEVLQQKIDNKLTAEQLRECEKLLDLDLNDLESWVTELVKEDKSND